MAVPGHGLMHDRSGKGLVKFTFATCAVAIAVASSSPAFQASPLIANSIGELREHLPETLDKITAALGG